MCIHITYVYMIYLQYQVSLQLLKNTAMKFSDIHTQKLIGELVISHAGPSLEVHTHTNVCVRCRFLGVNRSCSDARKGVLGTAPPSNFHICSRKCLLVLE